MRIKYITGPFANVLTQTPANLALEYVSCLKELDSAPDATGEFVTRGDLERYAKFIFALGCFQHHPTFVTILTDIDASMCGRREHFVTLLKHGAMSQTLRMASEELVQNAIEHVKLVNETEGRNVLTIVDSGSATMVLEIDADVTYAIEGYMLRGK